jgi:predicted O-methyltransferase YrrM
MANSRVNKAAILGVSRRRFDYDRRLLPNQQVAALEPDEVTDEDHIGTTDWSIGYPAWNLLYYSIYCSILPERQDVVVIETGTNRGVSTIVIAQALKDLGVPAQLDTVELDPELVSVARDNVEKAGLTDRVRFHVGDAIEFLSDAAERTDHFDFVLIDDKHTHDHVVEEMNIVCPKVAACGGKIYIDNSGWGEVATALEEVQKLHGGHMIHFDNCSWRTPGNAIWQAGYA